MVHSCIQTSKQNRDFRFSQGCNNRLTISLLQRYITMADWGHSSTTEHLLPTNLAEPRASPRLSALIHSTPVAESPSIVTMASPQHTTRSHETTKGTMFSIFSSKRSSMVCTYAFTIAFITCTILLVANPSRHSVSFGLKNLLQKPHPKHDSPPHYVDDIGSLKGHETSLDQASDRNGGVKEHVEIKSENVGTSQSPNTVTNGTGTEFPAKVEGSERINVTDKAESSHSSKGKKGSKKKGSDSKKTLSKKQGNKHECDLFDGWWIRDNSYPLYAAGTCPYIDEPFDCFRNGRPDNTYEKYRWQPRHCDIPRLDGKKMLKLLANKRLVYVGDSLNRNMWESLLCVLRNSVEDKSKVYEVSGREEFRTEGSYSFIFQDYNCSVEFFQSRFLVQEWEVHDKNGSKKETLRLDLMEDSSEKYKDADVLIFNTGHWWTHEKTSNGLGYYQEGDHVHDELNGEEAYRRALTTWGRWVDTKVDPKKTSVFFRGYSPSHFRGGAWNSGGQCHGETKPTTNTEYGGEYPSNMKILDSVMEKMKTPILYQNITAMTDFRKDAHPAVYRMPNLTPEERTETSIQDCSHWCLPGVPDTWNELIYAQLLRHNVKPQKKKQHKQKRQQQFQKTPH